MRKILTLIGALFFITLLVRASSPIKKVLEVQMSSKRTKITLFYRDSDFKQVVVDFLNPNEKDTLIVKEVFIPNGNVLRYSLGYMKDSRPHIVQKFFTIPEMIDTVTFEANSDGHSLIIKKGVNFFIQDKLNLMDSDPLLYASVNKSFLDNVKGRSIIDSLYKKNRSVVDSMIQKGLGAKSEHEVLATIAKTDYYVRLLYWARKNNRFPDIAVEMKRLDSEKEEMQSVIYSGLTDIFSSYFGYVIHRDKLDTKNTRLIVNSLLSLGWQKGITSEFLVYSLQDQRINPVDASDIYENIKKYFNGEFDDKLVKISKILMPTLADVDKIFLLKVDGKKLTFKQFMAQNPNKFILIDFWASWCVPCREEAPFFEKNKHYFKGKEVVFLSLSLDEDDKILEWRKALEDDGLIGTSNHYKLINPKISPLFKNFKISSIPRYILIDNKGKFVDSDFLRPSDPQFVDKLSELIVKKK